MAIIFILFYCLSTLLGDTFLKTIDTSLEPKTLDIVYGNRNIKNNVGTLIFKNITQNTTWTKGESTYLILENIDVGEYITFTIEPGTIIIFYPNSETFYFFGVANPFPIE